MKPLLLHTRDVVGDASCIHLVVVLAGIADGVVNAGDGSVDIKFEVIFQPPNNLVFQCVTLFEAVLLPDELAGRRLFYLLKPRSNLLLKAVDVVTPRIYPAVLRG